MGCIASKEHSPPGRARQYELDHAAKAAGLDGAGGSSSFGDGGGSGAIRAQHAAAVATAPPAARLNSDSSVDEEGAAADAAAAAAAAAAVAFGPPPVAMQQQHQHQQHAQSVSMELVTQVRGGRLRLCAVCGGSTLVEARRCSSGERDRRVALKSPLCLVPCLTLAFLTCTPSQNARTHDPC